MRKSLCLITNQKFFDVAPAGLSLFIFLAAAQPLVPLVGFHLIKQFRDLYRLPPRPEEMSKCGAETQGDTDEHLFTL